MSWVPRVVGPLFRTLRFNRRLTKVVSRVGKVNRIRNMKHPIRPPGRKLVRRHLKTAKKSTVVVGPMPFYRRRRYPLRRRVVRRNYRKTCNKIHTFVRWCDKDTTYGSNGPNTIVETGADQHLSYQFKLENVTGVTDFTNLYDGYKINKIQLFLESNYDQSAGVNNVNPIARRIRVVHDYNDATVLSNEDEYLEYGNCKSYFPFSKRGIRITLYPKLNNILENVGGAATAFSSLNSNRQFLNIATDEVPHFGIKMMIPGNLSTAENAQLFRVRAKFWLSMRGTK